MKVMQSVLIGLGFALAATSALAYSVGNAHALPENAGCHLMTAKECQAHLAQLGSLPVGQERDAYLAAHHALIQEREALCGSSKRTSLQSRANAR
jgi:hypothetical protein